MKKFLPVMLWIFSIVFINSAFAEDNSTFTAFIYKDNVVKTIYSSDYKAIVWKYLNWKSLSWTFVADEKWKIIHQLTETKINWKNILKLDNNILETELNNRINFLDNWSYLISEFAPPVWKNNYIILDWKKIFEWTNEEYNLAWLKKTIKIISHYWSSWDKRYYLNEKNELIQFVKWKIELWYFIDKESKDLVYDVVCKNNTLSFFYEWKEVINSKWARQFFFPEKRTFWVDTFLNINWKQYLLTDDDISFNNCNLLISSNPQLEIKEVKNSEIIKDIELLKTENKNNENHETLESWYFLEFKKWDNLSYILAVPWLTIVNINWKTYKLPQWNNLYFTSITESWNIFFYNNWDPMSSSNDQSKLYSYIFNWDTIIDMKNSELELNFNKQDEAFKIEDFIKINNPKLSNNFKIRWYFKSWEILNIINNTINKSKIIDLTKDSNWNKTIENDQVTTEINPIINKQDKNIYVKQLILSKTKLNKTEKWKKIINSVDSLVKKQSKDKLELIYKKIWIIKIKYSWEKKDILDFLEANAYLEFSKLILK